MIGGTVTPIISSAATGSLENTSATSGRASDLTILASERASCSNSARRWGPKDSITGSFGVVAGGCSCRRRCCDSGPGRRLRTLEGRSGLELFVDTRDLLARGLSDIYEVDHSRRVVLRLSRPSARFAPGRAGDIPACLRFTCPVDLSARRKCTQWISDQFAVASGPDHPDPLVEGLPEPRSPTRIASCTPHHRWSMIPSALALSLEIDGLV
jgi:hypothetical protein